MNAIPKEEKSTLEDSRTESVLEIEEDEPVEVGKVSGTKGGFFGNNFDQGGGRQFT